MIELRPDDGIHTLLYTATTLVEDGAFDDEEIARLVHTLKELREDTNYAEVVLDSQKAVTVPLIRKQCVILARKLLEKAGDKETLEGWISDGQSDPLPEVRLAALAPVDDDH
jgi:hypothetical protein